MGVVVRRRLLVLPEPTFLGSSERFIYPRQVRGFLLPWSPREHVSHQVGVHPANFTRVHIIDLKEVMDARITYSCVKMDQPSLSIDSDENVNIGTKSQMYIEKRSLMIRIC